MAAIFTWAKLLENKNVVLFSDNLDIVQIWTSGYTTNSQMMKLIRILFLFCARRNIHLSLRHIYGFKNCKADALSRLNISLFKQLHSTAEEEPSQVPTSTWELQRENGNVMLDTTQCHRHSEHTNQDSVHNFLLLVGTIPLVPFSGRPSGALCLYSGKASGV